MPKGIDDQQIKELTKQRGVIKSKLTRFKKFVNEFNDSNEEFQLRERIANLVLDFKQFGDIQLKLELLVADEEMENQLEERAGFEEAYFEIIGKANKILVNLTIQTTSNNIASNSVNSNTQILPSESNNLFSSPNSNIEMSSAEQILMQSAINGSHVKLPTIRLPTFSGAYEMWPSFADSFKSAVHNNQNLRDTDRLKYLRGCLNGKAAEKIESLETTDMNYRIAWNILEKYYNDPGALINNRVKAMFELSPCAKSSANQLEILLDSATKHYQALKALNKPFLEAFPIYAITSKLDEQTRLKWKEKTQGNDYPKIEELLEFLHSRLKILENVKSDKNEKSVSSYNHNHFRFNQRKHNNDQQKLSYASTTKLYCHICKGDHYTQNCENLIKASIDERLDIVKRNKLCFNCLRANHLIENCTASNCRKCKAKHHTLLHRDSEVSESSNITSLSAIAATQTILSTAIILIKDNTNNLQPCTVLLDSCSQSNLITKSLATKLGLKFVNVDCTITGINDTTIKYSHAVNTEIKSRVNEYRNKLSFIVVENLPSISIPHTTKLNNLSFPKNIQLADPEFSKVRKIEAIIGMGIFYKLLCVGQVPINNSQLVLQKTRFGWVLGGEINNRISKNIVCNLTLENLNHQLTKFWELEEINPTKELSVEERDCENHYVQNVVRDESTGRYTVKLPFNEHKDKLGESYSIALRRFLNLENSLLKNNERKRAYVEFLREYENLNHMSKQLDDDKNGYFLPHHGVFKQSSVTTKLRVVFDAASKTNSGYSLNDALMLGPNIQDDLLDIILRFRLYHYVVTADIEKMYRQVVVDVADRKYQKILWRENENDSVKIYTLNTLTQGTKSASFLATRVIKQLALDEIKEFPKASQVLIKDCYVDNILTGSRTKKELQVLCTDLSKLTLKGGFNLRQWGSNDSSIIEGLVEKSNDAYFSLNTDETVKVLGLQWNAQRDTIIYTIHNPENQLLINKRNILSLIAKLFDPLGLLGPVIIKAKLIMQRLWLLRIDWDESLPIEIHTAWRTYYNELAFLNNIEFSRKIVIDKDNSLQLHGFCDASERAYGACIYIRSINTEKGISSGLLCAKSRVAPLKICSLPRLELCAAVLLTKLYKRVITALTGFHFEKIAFWSDSTIVLHWINTPSHTLKTFVSNRISEIQGSTVPEQWGHVKSEMNPADLLSRGISPKEFINNHLWLNGPIWLVQNESEWPKFELQIVNIPEKRNLIALPIILLNDLYERYSSFTRLKRIIAYCIRFIRKCKQKKENIESKNADVMNLSVNEIQIAFQTIIRQVQLEAFAKEIEGLENNAQCKGNLNSLAPFMDNEGILRVGGRITNSNLSYSVKHPILLPSKHIITRLIIREIHINNLHTSTQATLNIIRQNYWIVNGRSVIRKIIHNCIKCFKAKPMIANYIMGNLPKNRLEYTRPFKIVGVDYCGPIFIKEKRHRNRNKVKVYIAIFVCFATKAVHIESSMT